MKRRNKSSAGRQVPAVLHEAIEQERDNLSRAASLLACLSIALEQEASGAKPYYADVAQLAHDLLRRSIGALDSLALQKRMADDEVRDVISGECVAYRLAMPQQEYPVPVEWVQPLLQCHETRTLQ